ncbi:MAG TPA: class I SAM-dependent methyltransferase [Mycobacteriales bacterium]|jgi:SAM-dependent methyltransferase|nr:class I SAM-dependent methyltransferase [Mycobacteriales bacterium]
MSGAATLAAASLDVDDAERIGRDFVATSLEEALARAGVAVAPDAGDGDGFGARLVTVQRSQRTDDGSRRRSLVRREVAWLARTVRPRHAVVLHPFCGPGHYASALRRYDVSAYRGLDRSVPVVTAARRLHRWGPSFRFEVADALATACPPDSADLALLTYETLNAVPEATARDLLGSLVRAVRPGGHLFVDVQPAPPEEVSVRTFATPRWSVFAPEPQLLLVDRVETAAPTPRIEVRVAVVPLAGPQRARIVRSTRWCHDVTALCGSIGTARVVAAASLHSGTRSDKPETARARQLVIRREDVT